MIYSTIDLILNFSKGYWQILLLQVFQKKNRQNFRFLNHLYPRPPEGACHALNLVQLTSKSLFKFPECVFEFGQLSLKLDFN